MHKFKSLILLMVLSCTMAFGQEFDVKVIVKQPVNLAFNSDGQIYKELQSVISDLINKTKWTEDEFKPHERIQGTLTISVLEEKSVSSFVAEVSFQTSRPVYNSDYKTPTLNLLEKEISFGYIPGQAVQRSDRAYIDNLSSCLTFYALIALGMDYDSFELYGGESFFTMARETFDALPPSIKSGDGSWSNQGTNGRSKYFLIENILSPRLRTFRQIFYEYHRLALDNMYENADKSRAVMLSSLGVIEDLHQSYPSSYLLTLFNDTKHKELVEIFKGGDSGQKTKVRNLMILTSQANQFRFDDLK